MTITLNGTTGITLPNGSASAPAATGSDTDTGIVYGTNTVQVATGGTTAVTVDSSQNVGIGTTSPETKLHVYQSNASLPALQLKHGDGDFILCEETGGTDLFKFSRVSGTNDLDINVINSSNLRMSTANTERMRIDSSGNIIFGATALTSPTLYFTDTADGGFFVKNANTTSATTAYDFLINGTRVGAITTSGSNTTYSTSSDYRLKENIAPMTGALGVVGQLKPCTYTWKVDGSSGQGFIAHELQAVVPDCVTGEKDAVETYIDEEGVEQTRPKYQGIDTSFLVATLTAAIQELKAELDTVKTELETLKGTA